MKKIYFILLMSLCISGCFSTSEIVVDPVRSWEGHYKTVEEFKAKTENLSLEKDESIWVLSNKTLSRVLKNIESKKQ